MQLITDVVVVGYGPVGQAMAIAMAQQGYEVVVVERWPALYGLPRAVGYDHEVARILQWLGVASDMAGKTATITDYVWRNGEGRVLKSFGSLEQIGISGWPMGQAFCQPELESVLDKRAHSFGDRVRVFQGWEVLSAREHDDHVTLTARPVEGGSGDFVVHAKFVVGCDGAGSVVRQAMGTEYEDLGFSADWLVVDYLPKNAADWSADMVQVCDPQRPTTLVASGPGRRRAEFMLLDGETKDAMNCSEAAWRLLARHGWTAENAALERHAVYTFRGCIARRWRVGRMALAGDAAHLTPPFAGQGLCAGLRDVAALSWRLHHVLSGRASPTILDSYGQERAEHARKFIDFAIELGHIICILDPERAAARDEAMLKTDGQTDDSFPASRLPYSDLVRMGDPLAGLLALQGWVRGAGQPQRFDDLAGYGFTLLSLDPDPTAELSDQDRAFIGMLDLRTIHIGAGGDLEDVQGQYAQWFAELGCRAVLIRPDFYLYGGGTPAELVSRLRRSGLWHVVDDTPSGQYAVKGSLALQYFAARQAAQVSTSTLERWLADSSRGVQIVDVRNPIPALSTRIPGAINMPEQDIEARLHELPRDKLLVLVCWDANCGLATSAAVRLLEHGFRVMELRGGIQAWRAMGMPLEPIPVPTA